MDGATAEAQRWLGIAAKLLEARDLQAAKKFAERAIDADPLLDGPDQILAAADILSASQSLLPSGQPDHYSVLQLPPCSDLPSIKRSYRRLALLLRSPSADPAASLALRLLSESFSFLSDDTRRAIYDESLPPATPPRPSSPTPPPPDTTFWTVCPVCFRAFEYGCEYEGRHLRCQVCRKAFRAGKLPASPPVVPGTDTFYCSWGLFPLGFPGGFSSVQVPPGTPSVPALPCAVSSPSAPASSKGTRSSARLRAIAGGVTAQRRKVMAKRPRRGQEVEEEEEEEVEEAGDHRGFDINSSSAAHRMDPVHGNLSNLSFLKEDHSAMIR